jgi:hypothetical protein
VTPDYDFPTATFLLSLVLLVLGLGGSVYEFICDRLSRRRQRIAHKEGTSLIR